MAAAVLCLVLLAVACAGEEQAEPTPAVTPVSTLSPTAQATVEEVFWIAVDAAGIDRDVGFDDAKSLLEDALFSDYDGYLAELERLGLEPFDAWPYCINAISGAYAIASLGVSQSPLEAAPHANAAIEAIEGLRNDVLAAQDLRVEAGSPSAESKLKCQEFEQEVSHEDSSAAPAGPERRASPSPGSEEMNPFESFLDRYGAVLGIPRDIWAYCRDVGTSADWLQDPPGVAPGYIYRCYQGEALYCEPGATAGTCMKLAYNVEEPPGMADWCREHPQEMYPPYSITGHGPQLYDWFCAVGQQPARMKRPTFDPNDYDDMGFLRSKWRVVPTGVETPVPPPPPGSTFSQPPPVDGPCASSYPEVCLPNTPPKLDCRHIPFRDFQVLSPDPHGLDPDGDGVGCESQ